MAMHHTCKWKFYKPRIIGQMTGISACYRNEAEATTHLRFGRGGGGGGADTA